MHMYDLRIGLAMASEMQGHLDNEKLEKSTDNTDSRAKSLPHWTDPATSSLGINLC
jgi:hypothetical protein